MLTPPLFLSNVWALQTKYVMEFPSKVVVWDEELFDQDGSHDGLLQQLAGSRESIDDEKAKGVIEVDTGNDICGLSHFLGISETSNADQESNLVAEMVTHESGLLQYLEISMSSADHGHGREEMLELNDQVSCEMFCEGNENLQLEAVYVACLGMMLQSPWCVTNQFSPQYLNHQCQSHSWNRSGFSPGESELQLELFMMSDSQWDPGISEYVTRRQFLAGIILPELQSYEHYTNGHMEVKESDQTLGVLIVDIHDAHQKGSSIHLLQIKKWSGPFSDFEFELVKLHMTAQLDTVEAILTCMDPEVSECQFSETVVLEIRQETIDACKIFTEMPCQAIFDTDHIARLASQETESMLALFGVFLEHAVIHADHLQGQPENMWEISATCQRVMVTMKWWHEHFSPWKSNLVWYCYEKMSPWNINIFNPGDGDGMSWHNIVAGNSLRHSERTECPFLNLKKESLAGICPNEEIYAISGGDGNDTYSEVEIYDLYLGKWICRPSMMLCRFALAASELNGVIHTSGIYDGSVCLESAERYAPTKCCWVRLLSLSTRRGCCTLTIFGDTLYDIRRALLAIYLNAPQTWKKWLALPELWYNSSLHSSLGCSPFKVMYGCEPNLGAAPTIPPPTSVPVAEMVEHREHHLQALKEQLAKAQYKMKLTADSKRRDFLEIAKAVPKEVVDCRLVCKGNKAIPQVKLTWVGLPPASTTWENYDAVKS